MSNDELLRFTKLDLQLAENTHVFDEYICTLIDAAISEIGLTGIVLDLNDVGDKHLVVQYAAWLYRRRANSGSQADGRQNVGTATSVPGWLQRDINNRLFSQKGA